MNTPKTPFYSVQSLLRVGRRGVAWHKYDKPFTFNIFVNDMTAVLNHKATKYQFIGNSEIRDLSSVTYIASSSPDMLCNVSAARSVRV